MSIASAGAAICCFHVSEQRFTLPQLADALHELELSLVGFILDQQVMARYAERFPDDPSATNLESWCQVRARVPEDLCRDVSVLGTQEQRLRKLDAFVESRKLHCHLYSLTLHGRRFPRPS
ncbi:MAG: hypothetical protein MZV65_41010 [Chromatiales bacterium]|nr:hypothetical protein [Chromatiales bacterium]